MQEVLLEGELVLVRWLQSVYAWFTISIVY